MPRLAGIEFEWTPEQKRLISQLTTETTGALVGVHTDNPSVGGEFQANSEASRSLLNLLNETNAQVVGRISDLSAHPQFAGVLAIALAW